jgi:Uncharacterized protein related to glutamine synthetase
MNTQLPDVIRPAPTVADMLQAILSSGINSEHAVGAVSELTKLWKQTQEWDAEKEFVRAFVQMQPEMKQVQATKAVKAKDGSVKFMVAPPEEIDAQARPIYQKYGFAVSFAEGKSEPGKITKICRLQHVGGHCRENQYTCRIGAGPPNATESQADGSAHSYAKRGAYCDALNIVIAHQELDARAEGGTITKEQADELARRVAETISGVLKSCGDLFFTEPDGEPGQRIRRVRKLVQVEPKAQGQ